MKFFGGNYPIHGHKQKHWIGPVCCSMDFQHLLVCASLLVETVHVLFEYVGYPATILETSHAIVSTVRLRVGKLAPPHEVPGPVALECCFRFHILQAWLCFGVFLCKFWVVV